MGFYANFLYVQQFPDLSIALPCDDQGKNLPFPRREVLGSSVSQGAGHGLREESAALLDLAQSPEDRFVRGTFYEVSFRS